MSTVISPKEHHAVIFDLDGVITKTASVHARAWKRMFDEFLQEWAQEQNTPFEAFDADKDYLMYVDGKPRYDGINSFLKSRGIELPVGNSEDPSTEKTVCGLGNKKNQMFLDELERSGIEVYQSTVELIKSLRKHGVKTALISSSKNCTEIINKVGLASLFDTKIDGKDAAQKQIQGKPSPDIFLAAAHELGVDPKHAVIVEDAISGVQAGKEGHFGLVIGVDRANQSQELLDHGADIAVKDLEEVNVAEDFQKAKHAIDSFDEIENRCQDKKVVFFFDYDGTLTPIVPHPDQATLNDNMREVLNKLAEQHVVAIISGRDRPDVEKHVKMEGIFYAGSHGFDIAGPNDQRFEIDEGKKCLPYLDAAEVLLKEEIPKIEGAWVERKKYSVAIHYRQVKEEEINNVSKAVYKIHKTYPQLRVATGKKIFELQPNISWNKGKALLWLLKLFNLDQKDVISFYFGDDVTDEDAFKVLLDKGIGIAIQEESKPTAASYYLHDPEDLYQFIQRLIKWENQ